MSLNVGIALAFVAMLCWGIGDFWIQKSTRRVGNTVTLFFMTFFGAVILFPFVWKNLPGFLMSDVQTIVVIGILCAVLLIAAYLDFEALRVGKLAIVEPIWSFEIPVAGFLAFFILKEGLSVSQITLIVFLVCGLVLVSLREKVRVGRVIFERGTIIALFGAVMMGASNFFMGWGARLSDPIMANFVADVFIALFTGAVLLGGGKYRKSIVDMRKNFGLLLQMSVADKVAWVAFAVAMTLSPIGVVTALSESYIIIAVILGLTLNRESLLPHQKIGLIVAVLSAIVLAGITG